MELDLIEIYRFLLPSLLKGFDPGTLDDFDESLDFVTKVHVVQELERNIVTRAVSEVFSEG